jgi:hypothetical protein
MSRPEYTTTSYASDVDVRAVRSRRPMMTIQLVVATPLAARVVGLHIFCIDCTRGAAVGKADSVVWKCAPSVLPRSDGLAAIT